MKAKISLDEMYCELCRIGSLLSEKDETKQFKGILSLGKLIGRLDAELYNDSDNDDEDIE
jgi:hypothetical protein